MNLHLGSMARRIRAAPGLAWRYAQRYPLEAFVYGALCLLFAWGARIFLSVLAFALMGGAIATGV